MRLVHPHTQRMGTAINLTARKSNRTSSNALGKHDIAINFLLSDDLISFRPEFFSDSNFTTALVVFITAMINHVFIISMFMTTQSGIWVGLLEISLREPS